MMFATAVCSDIEPQRPDPPKDDDPNLLEVTKLMIESERMAVETARNGEDALALLRAGMPPELVLLDLMMPVMNGWEFLDEVAKDPSLRGCLVLETMGALRKPMDLRTLLRTAVERMSAETMMRVPEQSGARWE